MIPECPISLKRGISNTHSSVFQGNEEDEITLVIIEPYAGQD